MKQQIQKTAFRLGALMLVAVLLLTGFAIAVSADDDKVITRIEWQNTEDLVYGSDTNISIVAYNEAGEASYGIYKVEYPADFGKEAQKYYVLNPQLIDSSFTEASSSSGFTSKIVSFKPREYGVSLKSRTVVGDGSTPYMLTVTGVDKDGNDLPADVRNQITYTVDGKEFKGTSAYGTYTVKATLPATKNYVFNANGSPVTELTATLTINREMDVVQVMNGEGKSEFEFFLTSGLDENGEKIGLSKSVSASATVATGLKAPKGTKYAQSFQVLLEGAAEGSTYSIIVPLTEVVYRTGCGTIDRNNSVYVYDENGTPVPAVSLGFAVSVNRGYVKISGIPSSFGTLTVSIAPAYSSGISLWWIIIIILIVVLILLVIFFFVGRKIFRKKQEEPAEEKVVETFAPVPVPVVAEEADADPTQPAMRGLVYIDVVKKPEEYGMMLMKEKAGEGVVVYRYRKSYLAKLALADGKIGEYYSIVKNALLRFRGVKARKSWNYEAFNQGRNQIARIIPNGKTLYLYLAIDPKTLEGTKYGAIDVSDKKKFEVTPSLMKIRGDRKLKFALELIEKVCGELLELKPIEKPEEDYKPANQSAEKLFEAGLIRKMAALAPIPEQE